MDRAERPPWVQSRVPHCKRHGILWDKGTSRVEYKWYWRIEHNYSVIKQQLHNVQKCMNFKCALSIALPGEHHS